MSALIKESLAKLFQGNKKLQQAFPYEHLIHIEWSWAVGANVAELPWQVSLQTAFRQDQGKRRYKDHSFMEAEPENFGKRRKEYAFLSIVPEVLFEKKTKNK